MDNQKPQLATDGVASRPFPKVPLMSGNHRRHIPLEGRQVAIRLALSIMLVATTIFLTSICSATHTRATAQSKQTPIVALIDSGAPADDPSVIQSTSMVGDDGFDRLGHGTLMLKTMREQNPDVCVMSVKVLDDTGHGAPDAVRNGIIYATDKGADILSLSFAGKDSEANATIGSAVRYALAHGVTVIASAGNGGCDARALTPANIEGVLTVGTTPPDEQASHADMCIDADSASVATAIVSGWEAAVSSDGEHIDIARDCVSVRSPASTMPPSPSGTTYPKEGVTATANTYTVAYNGNGHTSGSTASSSHTYGTSKALTANGFARTGFSFSKWNTKADGTGTSYTNQQSVLNLTSTNGATVTLYAQWTPNTVTVTFDGAGGTLNKTQMTSKAGYPVGNSNPNILTEWNVLPHSGWNIAASNVKTSFVSDSTVAGGRAYKIYRTSQGTDRGGFNYSSANNGGRTPWLTAGRPYTITTSAKGHGTWRILHEQLIDANGTGFYPYVTLTDEYQVISKSQNAVFETYHALGFYDDNSADWGNVSNWCQFTPVVLQEGLLTPLPVAQRPGYTFKGWFTAEAGGRQVDDRAHTTIITPNTNTTYYAQWEPNTVTVSFDGSGGTLNKTQMTSKTGYPVGNSTPNLLTYWNTLPNASHSNTTAGYSKQQVCWTTDSSTPNGRVVRVYRTEPGTKGGGYYYNGARSPALSYGTTYTLTALVKGSGKWRVVDEYLSLWDTYDLDGSRYQPISKTAVASDTGYKCVTLYDDQDTSWPTSNYIHAASLVVQEGGLEPLPVAVRPGYTFLGWFTAAVGGTQVDDTNHTTIVTPNTNTTYYAQWEPNTVTVSFDGNGGSIDKTTMTSKVGYPLGNSSPNLLKEWNVLPHRGWNVSATNLTASFVTDESVPGRTAIQLSRTIPATDKGGYYYTKADNGRAANEYWLDLGEPYVMTTAVKGSGVWRVLHEQLLDENGHHPYRVLTDEYQIVSSTQLATYHGWQALALYDDYDETHGGDETNRYGAVSNWIQFMPMVLQAGTLTPLPSAQRKGYIFQGWFTSPVGGRQVDDESHTTIITPESATTYYAQWEPYEVGGFEDPLNPDTDDDGYGDNLSFTIPSEITFAVRPDGELVAPTNATIDNHGDFPIHISSVKTMSTSPYSLVPSTSSSMSLSNCIVLLFGSASAGSPSLDASDYTTKASLPTTASWNISPSSSLGIAFSGNMTSLSQDVLMVSDEFAMMEWYVTAGENPST